MGGVEKSVFSGQRVRPGKIILAVSKAQERWERKNRLPFFEKVQHREKREGNGFPAAKKGLNGAKESALATEVIQRIAPQLGDFWTPNGYAS